MSVDKIQYGGNHYKGVYEHWNLVADLQLDYYSACASKYLTRHSKKNGSEDVLKAGHYVDKRRELINENRMPNVKVYPDRIHLARVEIVRQFIDANSITHALDIEAIGFICAPKHFEDLVVASKVISGILAGYAAGALTEPKKPQIAAVLGRVTEDGQFVREGYHGRMDCWQCQHCHAHLEIPEGVHPGTAHDCADSGVATEAYVNQGGK